MHRGPSMDRGLRHGFHDWSDEGIAEEEEHTALRRRRRRATTPSPPSDLGRPNRILGARPPSPSPSPRPLLNWTFGAKSPPSSYGRQSSGILWRRSLSPPPDLRPSRTMGPRPVARSVRTHRIAPRSPGVPAAADGGGSSGAGGSDNAPDEDRGGVKEIVSSLRDWRRRLLFAPSDASTSSAYATGGREEKKEVEREFSFPPVEVPPSVVDAAEVLDLFVDPETPRTTNARREFFEATMGATAGAARARTEEIKKELLLNRRVVDLVGLERWLRRVEALADLAWFTELCSHEEKAVPPLELFECAFRALENALSDELHRGANARRFWIGSVAVPEFFFCPVSKKVMENPVIITSGKTVDHSALDKWWNKHKRICPVTDEALTHSIFIPDVLIALCISQWRAANCITDVRTTTDPPAISPDEEILFKEVTLLDHSPSSCKEAILRLHDLVDKEQCCYLHLLGHSPGTIAKLASILPETCLDPDPELDDIVLKIMAKAASYNLNKEVLGDDQYAIPVLIARALLGPLPTRSKCAQILGLLADNYYNKIKIGELGGFAPLMELLSIGDIDVKRTVAMALASLCEAQENWSRFVREGVTDAAISLMREDGLVDEAHSILLQAEGFQLAMVDIMEKLMSFGGDAMCKKMIQRLWLTFIRSKPGRRRRTSFPSASASTNASEASSSSSAAGRTEESADNGGAGQTMKDVQAIISWLQMKSYYPRTYRYRH